VALGGALAGTAGAAKRHSVTRLYACVTQTFKTLNLTTATRHCPRGQQKISCKPASDSSVKLAPMAEQRAMRSRAAGGGPVKLASDG